MVCETPLGHCQCIRCINMCRFHDRLLQRGGFSAGRSCVLPFKQHHFPPLLGARVPDRLFRDYRQGNPHFLDRNTLAFCAAGRGMGAKTVQRR